MREERKAPEGNDTIAADTMGMAIGGLRGTIALIIVLSCSLIAFPALCMDDPAIHIVPPPQTKTESFAGQFTQLADQWAEHCNARSLSSNMSDYINDESYKGLVALGPSAIPYIMDRYRSDDLPWGFVLDDITGLQMIKDRNRFNPEKVKQDWLAWWKQQDGELVK